MTQFAERKRWWRHLKFQLKAFSGGIKGLKVENFENN